MIKEKLNNEQINKENNINKSIEYLKGVGPNKAEILNKVGIYTIKDLIEYYPRVYEDRTQLIKIAEFINNDNVLFIAKLVKNTFTTRRLGKLVVCKGIFTDETDYIELVWFNQGYLKEQIKDNTEYVFYGKVIRENGKFKMESPSIYSKYELSKIMGVYPIYPLTKGLSQNYIFKLINNVLDQDNVIKDKIEIKEILNQNILKKYNLCSLDYATKKIHLPKDFKEVAISRKRLTFDELFKLTTALKIIKSGSIKQEKAIKYTDFKITELLELIPFELTNAQKKVVNEIVKDMSSKTLMNRMIQGDVGSGKTIVAAIAIYIAVKNGFQASMMAPTTILANQHYLELKPYFDKLNITCEIITSNNTKKQKENISRRLESGEISVIFGTHSLIEDNIKFKNLSLVITDEQHRFGVKQRLKLVNKSIDVESIVMSATPIPRTLGLMLYGDLDLSIIDELPPGRKYIKTIAVDKSYEDRLNKFIRKEVSSGRQVYIVCPLVEENEEDMDYNLKSVTTLYEEYTKGELKDLQIAYIHGKMKNKEKDEIMNKFKQGLTDILISTTVIEVGVNVPNASLMIIENAERFGLAALHQLRGRVGRGKYKSYCILKSSVKSTKIMSRLKIMEHSNNGFYIAEEDLKLRGPGDFFGIRQSGLPEFKLADLLKDMEVLKLASEASKELFLDDPYLVKKENQLLKQNIYEIYSDNINNIGM